MTTESILVTDGDQRATLAMVRSLGRRGHRVVVCSAHTPSLAGASKYAVADVRVPDPIVAPGMYADAIGETIDRFRIGVLLPVSEPSLLAILPSLSRYTGVCVPMPTYESFRRISDKEELLRMAPTVGISTPRQRVLLNQRDAIALADGDLLLPAVLKPSRSVGESGGRRRKLGVIHIATRDDFLRAIKTLDEAAFPLLVQRRIDGPGIGVFLLVWGGQTVAVFCHRRIREKPPSGGVSVYRESISPDPDLIGRSRALLDCFDWRGVAMVEYKVDAGTGEAYLMEVNGRFWGSLQLAIDAGVDFPGLLVDVARGENVEPQTMYRVGVRSRWWWGDVDHLIARFRATTVERAIGESLPSRWRALGQFLTYHPGVDREEVFRFTDPRPFFRETLRWMRRR